MDNFDTAPFHTAGIQRTIDSRSYREHARSSSGHALDAQRSAQSPEQFNATYDQARDFIQEAGVTIEDITRLTDRFWEFYLNGRCTVDLAACTIVSIHQNLCIGSIAPYAKHQPHFQGLLQQLESFDLCGDFMLTEVGHGLDARNIETTATLSQDGTSFDLHTPSLNAAKAMPPVTPLGGVAKVAVVFAQMVVNGKSSGVRTFLVNLTNGARMCPGITSTLLPQRPGCRPLDHAVTSFSHVRLDRNCLLGEVDAAVDRRSSFFQQIQRVNVGGLALSLVNVPALKAGAYLAHEFSRQRTVTDPASQRPISILSFPTQYGPIVSAAAHAVVMEAAGRRTVKIFQMAGIPAPLKQALVCIFKATATYATQRHLSELTDRCGWRGLFGFNKISELQLALKGNSIAEGDVMVLCIRLASELLQGKYPLPPADNPDTLLAKHEHGMFKSLQSYLVTDDKGQTNHRSDAFAQHVTPRARDLVQAIGHRFAYDSAVQSDLVPQELLDVWESDCILEDAAWYVERAGMTNLELQERRVLAIERVRPHLQSIIDGFDMEKHHGAIPLVSSKGWTEFMGELPSFEGAMPRSKL